MTCPHALSPADCRKCNSLPPLTEEQFLGQVIDLATVLGWESMHVRTSRTAHGWRTAGQGTMAKGWPDLVLCRARDRRLIFAELKTDKRTAKTSPEQDRVLAVLGAIPDCPHCEAEEHVSVYVWRPADMDAIAEALR